MAEPIEAQIRNYAVLTDSRIRVEEDEFLPGSVNVTVTHGNDWFCQFHVGVSVRDDPKAWELLFAHVTHKVEQLEAGGAGVSALD